jgi:hypothetical protein
VVRTRRVDDVNQRTLGSGSTFVACSKRSYPKVAHQSTAIEPYLQHPQKQHSGQSTECVQETHLLMSSRPKMGLILGPPPLKRIASILQGRHRFGVDQKTVSDVFPHFESTAGMGRIVLQMCLASLVYHQEKVLAFDPNHIARTISLSRDPSKLQPVIHKVLVIQAWELTCPFDWRTIPHQRACSQSESIEGGTKQNWSTQYLKG